jgi:hypothetical protein
LYAFLNLFNDGTNPKSTKKWNLSNPVIFLHFSSLTESIFSNRLSGSFRASSQGLSISDKTSFDVQTDVSLVVFIKSSVQVLVYNVLWNEYYKV